ncbi:alpha/beta fold hydrolase [Prauserella oleivorans]|uniref:Alpha/beta fold hydrolase n=1 Tax=Prauserella oleivorans TaxID=1478153 RepID=A0ABW5W7R2_9PSEU
MRRNRAPGGPATRSIYRSPAGREVIADWCTGRLAAWPVEHERRTVTVLDAATHVVTAGSGDRLVVVVPGTNFSAATCLPLAGALAERFRVAVADLPGQPGLSTGARPGTRDHLAWYGRWLTALIDTIADGPVTLLGHSLGAAVAMSSDSPAVDRQVLLSPGGLTRLRLTSGVVLASTAWVLGRRPAASARMLRTMHAPGREPRADLVEWMTLIARHVRSSADPGGADVAASPVERVVAVGEHDVFLPVRQLAARVRRQLGTELRVVPSAGHLLIEEHPHELAAMVAGTG